MSKSNEDNKAAALADAVEASYAIALVRAAHTAHMTPEQQSLVVESLRKLASPGTARPTHRHAEGKLYRLIGPVRFRSLGVWHDGILYENAEGERFVRGAAEFNRRFTPLEPSNAT